jgi:trans-aconitate methyltransferase
MSFCAMKTQETVNAEWNAMAGDWDDLASKYRDQFYRIMWEETKLDPKQPRTILDFGCGTGLMTEALVAACPESKIICIDAAEDMILQVQQKIQVREWNNVEAHTVILSRLESIDEESQRKLASLKGKVDLIIASSVMAFVPKPDLRKTMERLAEFLATNGIFCQSDWPNSEEDPDGFSTESAVKLDEKGNLKMKSHAMKTIVMGSDEGQIFVGVAKAPSAII